jgi:cytochrome c oxidase cbb3-type subunit 3
VKKVSLTQILNDTVPIEEEESIMTDHEYDGIRELDNNLPPWWKWGFYISIVFAFVYMINYHLLGTPLQVEEYTQSIEKGEQEVQAYLASQSMNVDETSVVQLLDAVDLKSGKGIFIQYCVVCHKEDGGGSVGPNLTDVYWIHGGDIKDLFKTIKYGANNGMKSWKDELNPVQMQEVASYILTMGGTNPPDAKAPEGDEFIPATSSPVDSTATVEEGIKL